MQQVRPTTALIDTAALQHNLQVARKFLPHQGWLWAAVKGDAYGHGAVLCARALGDAGCDGFAVALVEEGVRLRDAGISQPILCLGGPGYDGGVEAMGRALTPVIFDEESAARLSEVAKTRVDVHIKVDTGMGRLGVPPHAWGRFLDRLASYPRLNVVGMMTHLAESEALDATFTIEQGRRFKDAVGVARRRGYTPAQLHVCNSGGILTRPELHYQAVRAGILLYGVAPDARLSGALGLKAAMRVVTRVLFVKDVPAGTSISYGRRFVTRTPTRIATLPVGYADGYPRSLRGAEVLVQGQRCPVVGTICMDLCMVDVTGVACPVKSGDEVVLLGEQGEERITAEELAVRAGTIPYEILCGFSERIPRVTN